jgi:small subunit ribosomal protein S8
MMTDPIADMLTRMRNALMAGQDRVEVPASKVKAGICKVLKDEGFIKSFKIVVISQTDNKIKIVFREKALMGIERVSRPGLRQYRGYQEIPRILSGLGTSVISTSAGIMSAREAKRKKLGGEVICNVW